MVSVITRCLEKQWINPPKWVNNNIILEVVTGSIAYGMNNDMSNMDIVSVVMPPKADIFPFSIGSHIYNFGTHPEPFTVYQKHHIMDDEKSREYDITMYSIVKIFNLFMENNPNALDVLFMPRRCVLHSTEIAEHFIANRKIFLSRKAHAKHLGYAFSQLTKIKNKKYENSKRKELIDRMGWDTKSASHLVRLVLQCRQILTEGDLDLERNAAVLRAIRNGEWTIEQLEQWFVGMEKELNELYTKSTLPIVPDEGLIKKLLLECIEMHYGNISTAIQINPDMEMMLNDFKVIIGKYETK